MRALEEVPWVLLPCCRCHLSWKSSSLGHPLALWHHPWGSPSACPLKKIQPISPWDVPTPLDVVSPVTVVLAPP